MTTLTMIVSMKLAEHSTLPSIYPHLLRSELSLVHDGLGRKRTEVAVILIYFVIPQLVLNELTENVQLQNTGSKRSKMCESK